MSGFYLGRATALAALPEPDPPLNPSGQRPSTVHSSAGGGRIVDLSPRSLRTYAITWRLLDAESFSILEEFFTGGRGPGPFLLLDPSRRNHLTSNQSGATSHRNDVTGFSVADGSGEQLTSSTTWQRGPRALRWSLPGTVTVGVLDLDPPPGLIGFPLPAGEPWTFSGTVRLGGILSSVNVTPVLSWRTADGAEIAVTSGTPVAAVPGAWTSWSVSLATPPAGAVYLRPQLRVTPGALTTLGTQTSYGYATATRRLRRGTAQSTNLATGTGVPRQPALATPPPRYLKPGSVIIVSASPPVVELLVDKLQLDMFGSARPWVMGTGIPQVSMTALTEEYLILPRRDCSATFVEVS